MGEDPEIRALIHQVNSYLNSKSTLLYQINLIKQKLTSKGNFSTTKEVKGIEIEIQEIPKILQRLKDLNQQSKIQITEETGNPRNYSRIFEAKGLEISQLQEKYNEEIEKYEQMAQIKDQLSEKLKSFISQSEKNPQDLDEAREKCNEIIAETHTLNSIIQELKEKLEFLNKKKSEIMLQRGNKRKTYLGMSIMNKPAMDLRSKNIFRQELIKTIQSTKAEQDTQIANFEERSKIVKTLNENIEEEENALNLEISQNKERIIELEWEVESLEKEVERMRNTNKSDASILVGSPAFFTYESDEGSLGNSFGSLLEGMKDYKLESEAIAEENEKLRERIRDIVLVKKPASVGFR